MSIFDRLGQQHRDIKELFSEVGQAFSMEHEGLAHALFQPAAKKLLTCIRAEHAALYPRLADIAELAADVLKARRQDARIESSIALLRIGGLHRDVWKGQLEHVIHLFHQNVDLKELSMFPIARLALMPRQLLKIDVDFSAHFSHTLAVAGASITYDPTPPVPREVRHTVPKIQVFELRQRHLVAIDQGIDRGTDEVIDLEIEEVVDLETDELVALDIDDLIEMDRAIPVLISSD